MRLFDILELGAGNHPNNNAVVHGDKSIKYIELYRSARKASEYLTGLNLPEGARAALLYENSIEFLIFYFAIARADLILVPIDNSLKPEKINSLFKDCGAELLIVQSKFIRYLKTITENSDDLKHIICNKEIPESITTVKQTTIDDILMNIENTDPDIDKKAIDIDKMLLETSNYSDDLAAIFYTSGSTGESKGVMLSHKNLCANTISTVKYLGLSDSDKIMVILPFYYIYGNSLLLTHVLIGGTLIVDNRFLYPEVILDTMETEKATGLSGVPSNFIILLKKSTLLKRDLKSLRYFTQAGGAMAPEITKQYFSAFSDKQIYIMYGQTEAAPRLTWLPPDRLEEKIGSIGIPLDGVRIRIINEKGNDVVSGESGELIASGDNIMLGYWNQPNETAETVRDGWLYTGDLARFDDEQFIFITGRKKEIIKSGGNRVSAKEVEETLLEIRGVLEVAVISIPDELLGEAVKAFIVRVENSLNVKDIQKACRKKISEHKIPTVIEFIDNLPKLQSGKVDKLKLKEMSL